MNNDVLIKVEGVSKKFCKSLKQSMLYGIEDIARDTLNLQTTSDVLRKDEFWAVDDVSFEVKRGECLGIIGRNGAGKSTLLKMLNGIFMPDKGTITIKGKVSALIEVGAGFHPMLTGRENIYVNGSILGMSKQEIDSKFDEIVDFAELAEFIDMPVKHYSSGMYVRLGFAIAVQSKPDILLLDEVLAVGDAKFRQKCFSYIKKISVNTALILISHSTNDLIRVAKKAIVISKAKVEYYGEIEESIAIYQSALSKNNVFIENNSADNRVSIKNIVISNKLTKSSKIKTFDNVWFDFCLISKGNKELLLELRFIIYSPIYGEIATISSLSSLIDIKLLPQKNIEQKYALCINKIPLLRGFYSIHVNFFEKETGAYLGGQMNVADFKISRSNLSSPHRHLLALDRDWYIHESTNDIFLKSNINFEKKEQQEFYG